MQGRGGAEAVSYDIDLYPQREISCNKSFAKKNVNIIYTNKLVEFLVMHSTSIEERRMDMLKRLYKFIVKVNNVRLPHGSTFMDTLKLYQ